MNAIVEKSEDQIAQEKEAVARMVGAKDAMQKAIARIQTLENCLKDIREQAYTVGKAYGSEVHLNVYLSSEYRYCVVKAKDLFDRIDNTIKAVL